ncbi:MAG: hypothetical protein ACLP19_18015 [Xanthobacteraceae bacterium]
MGKLRNWKHEKFAEQIAEDVAPAEAYVIAGFERHRANYFRLMRQSKVTARIAELRREREDNARAAMVGADQILAELDRRGVERVADFFDRDAAGILRVRDHQQIPVEVSIALLRLLRESLGINGTP